MHKVTLFLELKNDQIPQITAQVELSKALTHDANDGKSCSGSCRIQLKKSQKHSSQKFSLVAILTASRVIERREMWKWFCDVIVI